jgi:hypothetical protein
MTTKQTMARKLHAEITANVDAYYADTKDHATFSRDNGAIWERATTYGVAPLILALIRGDVAAFEAGVG